MQMRPLMYALKTHLKDLRTAVIIKIKKITSTVLGITERHSEPWSQYYIDKQISLCVSNENACYSMDTWSTMADEDCLRFWSYLPRPLSAWPQSDWLDELPCMTSQRDSRSDWPRRAGQRLWGGQGRRCCSWWGRVWEDKEVSHYEMTEIERQKERARERDVESNVGLTA